MNRVSVLETGIFCVSAAISTLPFLISVLTVMNGWSILELSSIDTVTPYRVAGRITFGAIIT